MNMLVAHSNPALLARGRAAVRQCSSSVPPTGLRPRSCLFTRAHGAPGALCSQQQQQQQRRRQRLSAQVCRAAAAGAAAGGGADDDSEGSSYDDDVLSCAPAFVGVDQSNAHYTAFSIDVEDYPGLLRVVSWVFNGLGCRVHNAVLRTDDSGRASDVFWVTDLRGRKLSDGAASDTSERLEEFVSYCAPPSSGNEFREFACGDIAITNLAHPRFTQVTISADLFSPGLLLELSSIIHGQGLSVVEGVIRGGSESPIPPGAVSDASLIPSPPPGRRVMRFLVNKGSRGGKLGYDDVSALVYTLRAVLGGDGATSTQPPNTELTALSCATSSAECSGCDEPGPSAAAAAAAGSSGGGSSSRGKAALGSVDQGRPKRGKGGVTL